MATPPRDGPDATADGSVGLSRLGRIAAEIIAPTSLLTAVFFYFGWSHAYWFFDYFGVNSTLLGLTTQDYLMRAVDGLFVPITVAAVFGLTAVWVPTMLPERLHARIRDRIAPIATPAAAGVGLLLVVNGLSRILWRTPLNQSLAVAPLCLAAGVLLLWYAAHRRRAVRPGPTPEPRDHWKPWTEWSAVFAIVALSLFWAANDYAAAVGTTRAQEFVQNISGHPKVIVYSASRLNLDQVGVRELSCPGAEAAFGFRYDGLVLVLYAGDQYVLLPERWTPERGRAIVLPRTDGLRLEFVPSSSREIRPTRSC
ncbi:hypothetical protein G5C66_19280 [Nocardioides sp. KC13]|uniref:Uncharacterized protein n=1 Tax=Nocardioides turkmenicus TaxID=2711220 RepID=A0A6M1R880_9ACTN|nr:hypothetical protein [Nocardioides sp. KC13]NGN94871.1 hypothetical protein [Nocardioides sp. KC13]